MKKTRVGRPSKGRDARTVRVVVKATENEVTTWKRQAKVAKMPLGVWILQPRRDEWEGGK